MSLATLKQIVIFVNLMLALPVFALAEPETKLSEEVEFCLACHSDQSLSTVLPSKEEMSVYLNPDKFASSIHGDKLACTDCHSDISDYPHPEKELENRRAYSLSLYESCKRCHFANYTKTLESIHYSLLSKGNTRAPVCVDCHGAHYVTRPDEPRARVSQTCKKCHAGVYETYSASVHGRALIEQNNPDVPVCSDCHHAHNIEDPRTRAFLLKTPELCGNCHANKRLMAKYGLSTKVLETYLKDFHGVSVTFYKSQTEDVTSWKPVCTDCHGVHSITKVTDPDSPVFKSNLVHTCKKCHSDATTNFPGAWLSHYEPSPEKAPLVYYVKLFYKIFISFTIGGLVLHILLHVWRVATNR
ncbi:MAG: cytochrome c3 family protein [Thermodesulfobacteriota bacterium]